MVSDLDERLVTVIDDFLDRSHGAPAVSVAVDGPSGVSAVARGEADPAENEPMTPEHAVRIASCTKTFVASAVLDLVAGGAFDLDSPALEIAPPAVATMLDACEYGDAITVGQLLRHRSGLVDHADTDEFFQTVESSGGSHVWTPLSQLAIALSRAPLFAPDDAFSYSDSGYVLLGLLVEHQTGSSLAAAVRASCRLDELGLSSMHWERLEPTPHGLRRARQFLDGVDTTAWNPTMDLFGGGGLVSTMPDLARWWSALFAGDVHDHLRSQIADPHPSTGPDGTDDGVEVGSGMFRSEVDGVEFWGHSGYWGLSAFHVPALASSVAFVATGRSEGVRISDLQTRILHLLSE